MNSILKSILGISLMISSIAPAGALTLPFDETKSTCCGRSMRIGEICSAVCFPKQVPEKNLPDRSVLPSKQDCYFINGTLYCRDKNPQKCGKWEIEF